VADMYDRYILPVGRAVIGSRENAETALKKSLSTVLDTHLVKILLEEILPRCGEYSIKEVEVTAEGLKPEMVLARDVLNLNGVTLLKAGSMLDDNLIERLNQKEEFDPVLTRIFVTGCSLPQDTRNVCVKAGDESEPYYKTMTELSDGMDAGRKIIVIVDDQVQVVNALRRELREAGYKAVGFTNVTDAFNYLLKEKDVFALITDFMMPDVTGDKFLREVQREHPGLPSIVITGAATRETIGKLSQSAKIVKVLPKPWDKQILIETIKELEANTDATEKKPEDALVK